MATDEVSESRDVDLGTVLHGERQVLEITSSDHDTTGTTMRARLPLVEDAGGRRRLMSLRLRVDPRRAVINMRNREHSWR
jgi:hypothetical protein